MFSLLLGTVELKTTNREGKQKDEEKKREGEELHTQSRGKEKKERETKKTKRFVVGVSLCGNNLSLLWMASSAYRCERNKS